MTTNRMTAARLALLVFVALSAVVGDGESPSTRRQCWEECVREIIGRCFLWKKHCVTMPEAPAMPPAGVNGDLFRSAPGSPLTLPRRGAPGPDGS